MMPDLALFRAALKEFLRPRKLLMAAVLGLLPALIALLWRVTGGSDFQPTLAYSILAGDLLFGVAMILVTVIYATAVISSETEGKTIVYLLMRPLPRWRVLLARFAAAMVVSLATVWISALLLAAVCFDPGGITKSLMPHDAAILAVGVIGYGALFLALATLLKRPLLVGILFAFGWESWVPTLPGSFQKVSLISYLRVLAPHRTPESEYVDLIALLTATNPSTISHSLAWRVLTGVVVVSLAVAFALFSTREFVPRDDAD